MKWDSTSTARRFSWILTASHPFFEVVILILLPHSARLSGYALPKAVTSLYLEKLPSALHTIMKSDQVVKIGRNVGGDLATLARDLPEFSKPPKKSGIVELGQLASKKNAVSKGTASLAEITAATLQKNLSKETHSSEWGSTELSDDQIQYAALDAWVGLQIWDVLKATDSVEEPLTSITPIGQPVSLFIQNHEVAHGTIVKQPVQFTLVPGTESTKALAINVSTTKTWAVLEITKVLAPKCVIPYHKQPLEAIQNGCESFQSFQAVVSISHLRTRALTPVAHIDHEPPQNPGTPQLIKPPVGSTSTEGLQSNQLHAEAKGKGKVIKSTQPMLNNDQTDLDNNCLGF
jgi:hypothetical protein